MNDLDRKQKDDIKPISMQIVVDGVRARKDRSLGLSISTPELSIQEKAIILELQGLVSEMTLSPQGRLEPNIPPYRIDRDIEQKTPGQRLRAVLYRLWEQKPEDFGTSEEHYKHYMNKFIEHIKGKLEPDYGK